MLVLVFFIGGKIAVTDPSGIITKVQAMHFAYILYKLITICGEEKLYYLHKLHCIYFQVISARETCFKIIHVSQYVVILNVEDRNCCRKGIA